MTEPCCDTDPDFPESLRKGLRASAVNIALLTARDHEGRYHGLAVTTAAPFSTALPSLIVAVRHGASAFPVIRASGLFCVNQVTSGDIEVLDRFSRSDLRSARFSTGDWRAGFAGLPYLATAPASFFCAVTAAHLHEDQTVFIGRIKGVSLSAGQDAADCDPLIWINGGPARLVDRAYA